MTKEEVAVMLEYAAELQKEKDAFANEVMKKRGVGYVAAIDTFYLLKLASLKSKVEELENRILPLG